MKKSEFLQKSGELQSAQMVAIGKQDWQTVAKIANDIQALQKEFATTSSDSSFDFESAKAFYLSGIEKINTELLPEQEKLAKRLTELKPMFDKFSNSQIEKNTELVKTCVEKFGDSFSKHFIAHTSKHFGHGMTLQGIQVECKNRAPVNGTGHKAVKQVYTVDTAIDTKGIDAKDANVLKAIGEKWLTNAEIAKLYVIEYPNRKSNLNLAKTGGDTLGKYLKSMAKSEYDAIQAKRVADALAKESQATKNASDKIAESKQNNVTFSATGQQSSK